MERRGCSLGCIIAALGLLLSCCLLPYLVSSVYSIGTIALDGSGTPEWLWGSWLTTVAGENDAWYMLLAEGPICCTGGIGLLIVVLGLLMAITGTGRTPGYGVEDEAAYYPEVEDWR
ncbi:MAG: hypothetical protein M8467_04325 [Anaerolineae bacterium]|nr:hypothetical protein [Anaerolineae bacterium]